MRLSCARIDVYLQVRGRHWRDEQDREGQDAAKRTNNVGCHLWYTLLMNWIILLISCGGVYFSLAITAIIALCRAAARQTPLQQDGSPDRKG